MGAFRLGMQSGVARTLAFVSCFVSGGCAHAVSPVVAVPARDVEAIVDEYSATRRVTVRAENGRSLLVTPEREPLLVVDERVVVPGDLNSIQFEAEAPLTEARRFGDALYFGRRRVALANVARARLVFGCVDDGAKIEAWNAKRVDCERSPWLDPDAPARAQPDSAESRREYRAPFERRHYFGLQLGGTALLQIDYRFRAIDRFHLDVGAYASPGLINGSIGLLYDVPVSRRWAVYGGAGGAVLAAVGERDPCGNEPGCVESSVFPFAYFRAGVSLRLGADRRDVIGFDAGLWSGVVVDSGPEGQVVNKESRTWPMAGLSYHRAL